MNKLRLKTKQLYKGTSTKTYSIKNKKVFILNKRSHKEYTELLEIDNSIKRFEVIEEDIASISLTIFGKSLPFFLVQTDKGTKEIHIIVSRYDQSRLDECLVAKAQRIASNLQIEIIFIPESSIEGNPIIRNAIQLRPWLSHSLKPHAIRKVTRLVNKTVSTVGELLNAANSIGEDPSIIHVAIANRLLIADLSIPYGINTTVTLNNKQRA